MFAVLVFMLVIVAIAVGVVVLVALPQIRSGEQVLSDDGRQTVARARSGLPGGPRPAPLDSGPIPEVGARTSGPGRSGHPG